MYGQYHLPRGKNPTLSCLIGFVLMDRAKQQNYSTIVLYSTSNSSLGRRVLYSSVVRVSARFHKGSIPFRRHVGHQATGSTCHTEIIVQRSRGEGPQSWRRRNNEQWGVKSQSCTFPAVKLEGRSDAKKRSWRDEATIISLIAKSASPSSSSS